MFKDNTRAMFGLEAVMYTGTYIYMVIQEIMVFHSSIPKTNNVYV